MAGAALVQCTFYGNAAPNGGNISSDCNGNVTLMECIVASSVSGVGVYVDNVSGIHIECTDIHGNAGGDWVGLIEELLGQDGNISEDPLFCDPGNGDFTLAEGSPCLPDINLAGCGLMGAHGIGCGSPAGVPSSGVLAQGIRLFPNFPNPFNPQTTIAFDLPEPQAVSLRIFDMSGRLVKELITAEPHNPGRHEVAWNGRNDDDRQVASGIYFFRLEAGSFSRTKRMGLVK